MIWAFERAKALRRAGKRSGSSWWLADFGLDPRVSNEYGNGMDQRKSRGINR